MTNIKKIIFIIIIVIVSLGAGWFARSYWSNKPKEVQQIVPPKLRPLEKYSIENLSKAEIIPSQIVIGEALVETPDFTSYEFSFVFDPTLQNKEKKKVTGVINIPAKAGPLPLVIMFRGFVDQSIYSPGVGTKRASEYFAKNGYITLAPDFFGYAGSDKESSNIFESRFQTYTTALTLLKSVGSVENWDQNNLFIWGHSNGGQVALTTLEASGTTAPTVLWAPVSKPFPYSVLYYTDESDDLGKFIRRELANFEEDYDVDQFSIHKFYNNIQAPLQIHQGTADDAVPVSWTDSLVKTLKADEKVVDYHKYPGADHNLNPSWSVAVQNSLEFYNENLK